MAERSRGSWNARACSSTSSSWAPARPGLAAAIRLRQLAAQHERDVSVCVLDKASALGAHTLSGAVLEPRALNELLPDWQDRARR